MATQQSSARKVRNRNTTLFCVCHVFVSNFLGIILPLLPHLFAEEATSAEHVDDATKMLGSSKSVLLTVFTKRHVNFAGTVVAKHLTLTN